MESGIKNRDLNLQQDRYKAKNQEVADALEKKQIKEIDRLREYFLVNLTELKKDISQLSEGESERRAELEKEIEWTNSNLEKINGFDMSEMLEEHRVSFQKQIESQNDEWLDVKRELNENDLTEIERELNQNPESLELQMKAESIRVENEVIDSRKMVEAKAA